MTLWDGLITAEEQRVYEKAGYGKLPGLGTRAALLIVDVEYNFTGEAPEPVLSAIEKFKDSCGLYAWTAVPYIRRLLELARQRGAPVFFTHGVPPQGTSGSTIVDRGTTIIDELKPNAGEIVIAKEMPSAFFGTHLASYLVRGGIDSVIVTGCTTSGCVRATVLDSYSYGFRTVVPIEAVFDRADTPHRVNLFDMAMKYAAVLPVHKVEAWLSGGVGEGDVATWTLLAP